MVSLVSNSVVIVCESFSNYFNRVGEEITCVDGLNSFKFASFVTEACGMLLGRVGRMQLGVTES